MLQRSQALHWPLDKACSIHESTPFEAKSKPQWNCISESVFRGRVAGVDVLERLDLRFLDSFTESAVVLTKLGGDEVAGTEVDAGGNVIIKTNTEWDTGTDVADADVATNADPETH